MHDKPARAAQYLEEYKRVSKNCGGHLTVENGELVVDRATAPLIDDTVAAINKRHREATAPPADEQDEKPAARPRRSKPAKPATAAGNSAD